MCSWPPWFLYFFLFLLLQNTPKLHLMFACGSLYPLPSIAGWSLSGISDANYTRHLSQHLLKAWQTVGKRFCGWVGVRISHLQACWVPSCTKGIRTNEWRLHLGTRLTSPFSMSYVGVLLGNGTLQSIWREQPITLATAWVVCRNPLTPLANNSIKCSPVSVLDDLFCDKKWPVGNLSPHY